MHPLSRSAILGVLVASALPTTAFATNGSFLIGQGANHRAIGGAGTALPLDGLSPFINPALAYYIGTRADVGVTLFSPKRRACTNAVPECVRSGSNFFVLPGMGGAMRFNRNISVGFAASGVGGGSTRYPRDIFTSGGPLQTVGIDLKQMVMAPSIAYRLNKTFTVGASPLIGVQQFRAYGLGSFITPAITSDPGNVTNRGNDFSFGGGVRLGGLASFYEGRFRVGASYSSKIYMTKLNKYRGLLTPKGKFDIPSHFEVGLSIKPTDKLTVAFDIRRNLFSDVQAFGNSIVNTVGQAGVSSSTILLGNDGGGGFGWQDQTVYRLGFIYKWNDKLKLMSGFNYGKSPIPEDDNLLPNTLAPATVEKHLTLGVNYAFSQSTEVTVSYMHAFKNEQSNFETGNFNISPGGGARIEMVQNAVDVGFSFKF